MRRSDFMKKNLVPGLFLIVLLHSGAVFSSEKLSFSIDGKKTEFVWFKEQSITISASCVKSGQIKKCQAKQALDNVKSSLLEKDHFGRNPGTMLCSEQLKGTVVWAKDKSGNERTFCKFSDGSLVGSGSLFFYGNKNSR
jgi:hypothetical protein